MNELASSDIQAKITSSSPEVPRVYTRIRSDAERAQWRALLYRWTNLNNPKNPAALSSLIGLDDREKIKGMLKLKNNPEKMSPWNMLVTLWKYDGGDQTEPTKPELIAFLEKLQEEFRPKTSVFDRPIQPVAEKVVHLLRPEVTMPTTLRIAGRTIGLGPFKALIQEILDASIPEPPPIIPPAPAIPPAPKPVVRVSSSDREGPTPVDVTNELKILSRPTPRRSHLAGEHRFQRSASRPPANRDTPKPTPTPLVQPTRPEVVAERPTLHTELDFVSSDAAIAYLRGRDGELREILLDAFGRLRGRSASIQEEILRNFLRGKDPSLFPVLRDLKRQLDLSEYSLLLDHIYPPEPSSTIRPAVTPPAPAMIPDEPAPVVLPDPVIAPVPSVDSLVPEKLPIPANQPISVPTPIPEISPLVVLHEQASGNEDKISETESESVENLDDTYLRYMSQIERNTTWKRLIISLCELYNSQQYPEFIEQYSLARKMKDQSSIDLWQMINDLGVVMQDIADRDFASGKLQEKTVVTMESAIFEAYNMFGTTKNKYTFGEKDITLLKTEYQIDKRIVEIFAKRPEILTTFTTLLEIHDVVILQTALQSIQIRVPVGVKRWIAYEEVTALETNLYEFLRGAISLEKSNERDKAAPPSLKELRHHIGTIQRKLKGLLGK